MGEVSILVGARSFKLGCDEGEEEHLLVLAGHLNKHVEKLRASLGKTSDEQLFLMAGLMVCDELWDSRDELGRLEEKMKSRAVLPIAGVVMAPPAPPKPPGKDLTVATPVARLSAPVAQRLAPTASQSTPAVLEPLSAPPPMHRPKPAAKQT